MNISASRGVISPPQGTRCRGSSALCLTKWRRRLLTRLTAAGSITRQQQPSRYLATPLHPIRFKLCRVVSVGASVVERGSTVEREAQGINLRALGKLALRLGFSDAGIYGRHAALVRIAAEVERVGGPDSLERLSIEPSLMLDKLVRELDLSPQEVVLALMECATQELGTLGIGELRQVVLQYAGSDVIGGGAFYRGVAARTVALLDAPPESHTASADWQSQCVADIVWSLRRAALPLSPAFSDRVTAQALHAAPTADIFQLGNLAYRYSRAGVYNRHLFRVVSERAAELLDGLGLEQLPRLFLKFETCAEFCEREEGETPGWWAVLCARLADAAARKSEASSLDDIYKVAGIIVAEGIPPETEWVRAVRPTLRAADVARHRAKWLAKCVRTIRWAGVSAEEVVEACIPNATEQVSRMSNAAELADTAMQFACAGAHDEALFAAIADAGVASCLTVKNGGLLARVASKFAASGIEHPELAAALISRAAALGVRSSPSFVDIASSSSLRLWSDSALVTAWNVSRTVPPAAARAAPEPCAPHFADPTAPLALDIGCGYGGFVLGMARQHDAPNWLGVDSLPPLICRARGVASRWQIEGRAQFVHTDAVSAVEWAKERYAGRLELVCIQFPTPYQSKARGEGDADGEGNEDSQVAVHGKGRFMVDAQLASVIVAALPCGGRLLLQSNVEAVARSMEVQFKALAGFDEVPFSAEDIPCSTETEAACRDAGKPIHRVVLLRTP